MIGLGLRLTIGGGREAIARLVVLAVAVGVGVGLLLSSVAAINAVTAQDNRYAWLDSGRSTAPPGAALAGRPARRPVAGPAAPLWLRPGTDEFSGQQIYRVDIAATGPSSPVPPGIPRDPGAGRYYVSPALAALLRSTPASELAVRYPGTEAGLIGDSALPAPGTLMIIIGRPVAQLAGSQGAREITAFDTVEPSECAGVYCASQGLQSSVMNVVLSVIALALLAPVLIFIVTATRLSAARREQRFAAMRLVGATRRQVSVLVAVESTMAAVVGVAVGFTLFFALRVPLAGIPFTGTPFFPGDLSLTRPDILAVVIGVPALAAVVARMALRRVQISPLGVARRVTPRPPRAWRVIPLVAGVAELAFFLVHGQPASISGQVQANAFGFALVIAGLMIAGPWLTMTGARIMANRTSRPGALIAARRLVDDPHAAFRAVSGLVLALFVMTVAVAVITTENAKRPLDYQGAAAAGVLVEQLSSGEGPASAGGPPPAPPPSAALLARLRQIGGVQGIVEVHDDPGLNVPLFGSSQPAGLVSCGQLAQLPALGRCPAGAVTAAFPLSLVFNIYLNGYHFAGQTLADVTWPAAHVTAQRLATVPLDVLNVGTDDSTPAVENARTALDDAYPAAGAPSTLGESSTGGRSANNAYQQLADVVILASLPIAGCALAVSVAAGMADRKRPFSLLRLTGARLAMLRRVVVLETAVPLLVTAAVSIGAGFAASALFASAQLDHPLVAPPLAYYLITAAGLVIALGIITGTFPLLARITGPEVARNE